MTSFLDWLWNVINTPAGITVAASVLLWLLARLYIARPAWAAFEGTIISAVKFAEKEIPDDTPSAGLRRLDAALQYVLRVYEQARGQAASEKTRADLKEGIQIIHNQLEEAGTLN